MKKIFEFVKELFIRLEEHHFMLISAGITFHILLYSIPLMLLGIFAVNMFLGETVVVDFVFNTLNDILPPTDANTGFLKNTLGELDLIFKNSGTAGWIGIITLVWVSSSLFYSLRTGLNNIFGIKTAKFFLLYILMDMFWTIITAVLILISTYILPLGHFLINYINENFNIINSEWFSQITVSSISIFTSLVLFYLLFKFVPNKKIPSFIVNFSTILCVVVIEISRNVFAWYLVKFATYSKFWGTYAVIVSVAFWTWYMIMIVLIIADFTQLLYEYREKARAEKKALATDEIKN